MNKEELKQIVKEAVREETSQFTTKTDLKEALVGLLTKDDLGEALTGFATKEELRQVVYQATANLATKSDVDDVRDVLNEKMDAMLNKMDDYSGDISTEEQERVIGDRQLERRIEKIEERVR